MGKIISKCSVCGVVYGEKESFSDLSGVSHGYCEECLIVEMQKVEAKVVMRSFRV